MPDLSTLQQIDQGQWSNPQAAPDASAAAPPSSAWLAPGLPQPTSDIAVVGPATEERYRSSPPAPPSALLKGYGAQDAVDDYATYLNWKAQQAGQAPTKPDASPMAVVAPVQAQGPAALGSSTNPMAKFRAADLASDAATKTPPASAAPAPASTPNGAKPLTGYTANVGAGVNDAIAGAAGAPVDLATGALNLIPRGINAVAGTDLPTIQNPVGGSAWMKSAMGLIGADPRNVEPDGVGQQLARSAASGAASAVLPMGAAGQVARAAGTIGPVASGVANAMADAPLAGTAASGAMAGTGGAAAVDAAHAAGVPDAVLPTIDLVGQLAGGGVGALGAGAAMVAARGGRAAADAVTGALPMGASAPMAGADGAPILDTSGAPVSATSNQAARVGASLAARAGMSPADLAAALPEGAPAVPGSLPTAGQATGNMGLLGLERNLRTADPEGAGRLFADRRVEQNAAQLAHLETLAPADAQAHAAGNYFVGRLNQIDAQEAAGVAQAHADYERHLTGLGGTAHPADVGARMAGSVAARYQPALSAADAAIQTAQGRVAEAAEAAGGGRASAEGETARQGYGRELQDRLVAIRDAANRERRELYAARDPDGKLAIKADPIRKAARDLRLKMKPEAGDTLTPREDALITAGEKMSGVASMEHIAAFRKNVNAGLREATAARNVGASGAAEAVRRLTILKHSVDAAEAEATERAAAGDAGAKPSKTVLGRLADHVASGDQFGEGHLTEEKQEWYRERDASNAQGRRAVRGNDATRPGGVSPAYGGEGAAGRRPLDPATGAGLQGVSRPESLTGLLIRHGGIKEESGELAAMGFTNRTHPTLVRGAGMSHDAARELAIEHGFLPPDSPNAPNASSTSDVRNLLAEEAAGRKQYTPEASYGVRASQSVSREADADAHQLSEARDQVLDHLDDGDSAHFLPSDWVEAAARDVAQGRTLHEAVTDAQTGYAHQILEADTRARYFGSEPGLHPRASQDGMQVDGSSGSLTENLTAEDAARFKAADAFNRDYMARFGPKTAAGEALAVGPGGDLKMKQSEVASKFWKRGPAGADSTQQLTAAMGSRDAAEKAIGGYAAFDLRTFARENDGLSAVKLQKWLDAHADALNEFPGLRQKFGTLQKAQGTLDALQTKRAEIESLNPIKPNATGADTLAQFIKPGPGGGEAVDAFMKHSGQTPEAKAALADGFAHSLRAEKMRDGDLTAKSYTDWRARYASALDRVPDVRAQFDSLGKARQAVEDAAALQIKARADYLSSVAKHYLTKGGDPVEPQAAVRSILSSPTGPADAAELVRMMKGDADALKGLRQNFADWIVGKATGTTEAGTSGVSEVLPSQMRKIVDDPRTMAVLSKVFTPEQMKGVLEAVAADARMTARSHNATKIPGSPGTAADLNATHTNDPHADVTGAMGAEVGGELIGHVLGLGAVARILVRGGAIAGKIYYGAAKAAGIQTERDLMAQALLNPDLMRALLSAARQTTVKPAIMGRLAALVANLSAAGTTMRQHSPIGR